MIQEIDEIETKAPELQKRSKFKFYELNMYWYKKVMKIMIILVKVTLNINIVTQIIIALKNFIVLQTIGTSVNSYTHKFYRMRLKAELSLQIHRHGVMTW